MGSEHDGYHVAGRTDYDRWQSALRCVAELERENARLVKALEEIQQGVDAIVGAALAGRGGKGDG